jgi:hypothetical protein
MFLLTSGISSSSGMYVSCSHTWYMNRQCHPPPPLHPNISHSSRGQDAQFQSYICFTLFLISIFYYSSMFPNILKITFFWDVMIALKMEAIRIFETSLNLYKTTWRNIPEDCSYSPSWEPEISRKVSCFQLGVNTFCQYVRWNFHSPLVWVLTYYSTNPVLTASMKSNYLHYVVKNLVTADEGNQRRIYNGI